MEVNLFAGKNLPNGAIFSVRAGAVRRQAAAANQRPFRFPSKPMDSPLKVEVFRPVGAAYVVLRPGEDQYKVQFAVQALGLAKLHHGLNRGAAGCWLRP
mmetsp:Transcript_8771/g.20632  ORF Transcript_8771/g.20632 Transcript_8771/m.20632 type:complete len:99 (+) Transcript_8771:66-362(+)